MPTLIGSPSCISLLQWDIRVRPFSWLILFTLCMHGIEMVTLLDYVEFVLHLCMQYMENGWAGNGRSMELGGVGEAGAVGCNSTLPPPGSAAAIDTAAYSNPMTPPLPLVSAPQQHQASMASPLPMASTHQQKHPGVMPPPAQSPLATASQDQLNLRAQPFRPRPRPQPLLLPVEMLPLCCFGFSRPGPLVFFMKVL
jgi:hypothetical protein